jgi:hypothetical protein
MLTHMRRFRLSPLILPRFRCGQGWQVSTISEFPRVAFTPAGDLIVAVYGSSDTKGAIQFWRVSDGASVAIFDKPNHVHDIAFSPQRGMWRHCPFRILHSLVTEVLC